MNIRIIRGSHQIGGCITEITTDSTRIIIDMGEELPSSKNVGDFEIDGVTTGNPNCDAIFITHYHGDHVGLYKNVLPDISIYMGEVAKELFLTLATHTKDDGIPRIKGFKTFKALDKIIVKDITITPLLVDHSAFDAYMFLIESDGKRILYTGDFRLHGFRGKAVLPTLKKYVGTVDVLITEGTSFSRESPTLLEEAELQILAKQILSENKYVFVLCASTNIDRIAAFYHATPRGKYFLCDGYQKRMLSVVTKYAKDKTTLYDFQRVITYASNLEEKFRERGFCMLVRCNDYSKRIMDKYPDAVFLYSMWDGYTKGKCKNAAVALFTSWYDFQPFHTSGHASKSAIKAVCDALKPRLGIIPIHSEATREINNFSLPYPIRILEDKETFIL
jgi:ribonuclease J